VERHAWNAGSALVPLTAGSTSLAVAGAPRKVRQAADVVVRKVARLMGVCPWIGFDGVV
jgi:hypothetical protein